MGSTLRSVTTHEFDQLLSAQQGLLVVDVGAPWCAPCRAIAPAMGELATTYAGRVDIVEVNADEENDLAVRYQVSSMPTLLMFKDGKLVDRRVGAAAKSTYQKWFDGALTAN